MKTLTAAACILMMTGAAAYAADDSKMKSSGDAPAASGQNSGGDSNKMAPGTTGAMQKPSEGVATTPDEVQKQGGAATAPQKPSDPNDKAAGAGEKK